VRGKRAAISADAARIRGAASRSKRSSARASPREPRRSSTTSPSAVTISTASTQRRTLPYRTDRAPAALVETTPPAVAHALLEGSGGSRSPAASARRSSSDRDTLALALARRREASISRRWGNPVRSRITPSPTLPPPMALPAPRGTSATPWVPAHRMTDATSSRSTGTLTAAGRIRKIPAPSAYAARARRSVRKTPRVAGGGSMPKS